MRARTSSAPEMSSSELSDGSWNAVSLDEAGTETREGRLWCAVVEVWRVGVRPGWLAEEEEDVVFYPFFKNSMRSLSIFLIMVFYRR